MAKINFNAFPSVCLVPPTFVTSESAIVCQGDNTVSDISDLHFWGIPRFGGGKFSLIRGVYAMVPDTFPVIHIDSVKAPKESYRHYQLPTNNYP